MKKIVSVLLCLVMMMSLCTVAFAAGTDYEYCSCENQTGAQELIDNGDGTHYNACATCHKRFTWSTDMKHGFIWPTKDMTGDPDYDNGEYCNCGAKKSDQKPECKHDVATNYTWVSNENGTHKVICKCADVVVNEAEKCVYEKGVCKFCGYECGHVGAGNQKVVDNGDGTHNAVCVICGEIASANIKHDFIYENNTKCLCGAVKPADCKHEGSQKLVDNGDGTHNAYCPNPDCNELMSANIPHSYLYDENDKYVEEGGIKCLCGAVKDVDCKHEGAQKLVPNADGKTHNAYCPECDELMSENIPHSYWYNNKGEYVGEGGTQCRCGYNCKHDNGYVYTDKGDGVHHEGFCADCGKHIATEDGKHSDLYFVNNKNGRKGTHTAFCGKCGAEVYTEKHNFKGSKCVDCGAKKSTSSSTSTTTDTTKTTKSPKTGDMGVVLYAATALLSLSGTAVVIKKRKNDK